MGESVTKGLSVSIEFPEDAYLQDVRVGSESNGSVVVSFGQLFVPHQASYELVALAEAAEESDAEKFKRALTKLEYGDRDRTSAAMAKALRLAMDAKLWTFVPEILSRMDKDDVVPYRLESDDSHGDFPMIWTNDWGYSRGLHRLVIEHFEMTPDDYADWGDMYEYPPKKFTLPGLLCQSFFE